MVRGHLAMARLQGSVSEVEQGYGSNKGVEAGDIGGARFSYGGQPRV